MLHTNNPIIKHKVGLLNLAQELQNVSRACKVVGVPRDTFYRYQELAAEGGVEVPTDKSRRSPNLKNRVDESIGDAVKAYAVGFPARGRTAPATDCVNRACSCFRQRCAHRA